nr:pyridoxamine 5'-phosphate oxidase family protein [uncultured Roseibium sp.]
MTAFDLKPEYLISDEAALRGLFPPTHELAKKKGLTAFDKHARDFIERSPFVCLGTQNADGKADVSPRGDPPGFVKVLDDQTLAIPERPGNNRLDSLVNIVTNPSVGLLFIIPGFDDTLRVNGQAALVVDPELLKAMSVKGRSPAIAIHVRVTSVFMHCAKAFRRSHLWDPTRFRDRGDMPSLMKIIMDQAAETPASDEELTALDEKLEESYQKTLY